MKGRTSTAVLGPLASEPVGEVLEVLMDKGLALRHHWWHLLNNYPVAEKKKQTLRATVVWLNMQSRQSLGEPRPQQEPGASFSGDPSVDYCSKNTS